MDLFRDNISFSNLLMTRKLIRIDYLTALLQEKNIPERSLGFKKNIESFLIKETLIIVTLFAQTKMSHYLRCDYLGTGRISKKKV